MDLYYWLFPPIMTAAPLLMVWLAERILPPAPNTPFRRWGKVLLPIAALAIVAGYLAALWSFGPQRWITHGLAYLYFPVWGMAMALTIRPDPNFGERNLSRVERSASLKPRRREMPITAGWWTAAWSLSAIGSAVLIAAAFALQASSATLFSVLLMAGCAVLSVAMTQRALPMTLEEPEPLGVVGEPSLQQEYARFRNYRVWGLFAMFALGMPILLLGMGAGLLCVMGAASSGATFGIVGGVVGSIFGLLGAAFGVAADMKRKKLREMLRRTDGDGLATRS